MIKTVMFGNSASGRSSRRPETESGASTARPLTQVSRIFLTLLEEEEMLGAGFTLRPAACGPQRAGRCVRVAGLSLRGAGRRARKERRDTKDGTGRQKRRTAERQALC